MGKEYSFHNVLSCTSSIRQKIVRGNVTAVTESNNGSVIGRSVVGGIIAGPAGASADQFAYKVNLDLLISN